jgi:uncharacterized membrane protein
MNHEEIQPNRELRAYARQQLNGVWGAMALTFFIYSLFYLPYFFFAILDSIMDSMNKYDFLSIYFYMIMDSISIDITDIALLITLINFILSIAVGIVAGPFALGFAGYFLKRVRGEEIDIKNIFDGFSRFSRAFWCNFITQLLTSLWLLLFIIPGIVKALGYSMAYYIMYDNPEIKALEAINRSQIMMKGYKFKLFLLYLSFIGWILLASLSFGIGFYWLYPYIYLSMANFYENLKRNQGKQTVAKPDPFATPGVTHSVLPN